ncbi:TonB-dependent siderophore receptor [Vibrio sp. WJH972]
METRTQFKRSILSVALLSILSTPSFAEETQHETITVLGQTYRNTATKTALEPEETPQGITVIEQEQLEQRGVKSLGQALRYAPGVTAEQRGGAVTLYDTFNIRGFDVSTNYYDGMVLPYLNGFLPIQIDPIALQQVEVFKGPTSVLYGSMPPGGMVNMIAKTPQSEPHTEVSFSTGSRNLVEASIDTTGQFGDSDFSYRFIGKARTQDSQADSVEEERYLIAPSVDWQVSEQTLINFNLYYQNDPALGMDSSLPAVGMFIDHPLGSTSPSTFTGADDWSTFEREVLMLGYKINHDFNNGWTFLQNARYIDASTYREDTYYYDGDFTTGDIANYAYSFDEDLQSVTIDNQLTKSITTGSIEHNLLFGFDYQSMEGSAIDTTYYDKSYVVNIFNPSNDYIDRNNMGVGTVYNNHTDVEQFGFYAQDQLRIDNLVLIAGGRYDSYKSENYYYGVDFDADHSNFSYRVGGLYDLGNGFSPFISYATSFEPAAGVDVNGDGFDPQIGKQIEVGLKYLSMDMSKQFTMSYFHITKEDYIVPDPEGNYPASVQLGEVVSQGAEFEGRWFATDNLDLAASYTYIDMEVTEDVDSSLVGTTPIYVPTHAANLWANYHFYTGALDGLRVGSGVRYMGEMEGDATNSVQKVPSYSLVDLSLGYDLGNASESLSGAQANLVVSNLFDEEYYTCYSQAYCWYGAEQSIEFNVKYEF